MSGGEQHPRRIPARAGPAQPQPAGVADGAALGLAVEGLWDETVPRRGPLARPGRGQLRRPPTWSRCAPLASELTALDAAGTDALVDAGRLGAAFGPTPPLRRADAVVLVTRTSLEAVNAVRLRLPTLRADLDSAGTGADALGLLLGRRGPPCHRGRDRQGVEGADPGCLAWDPAAARVLSAGAGRPRRFDSSTPSRSTDGLITRCRSRSPRRRSRLAQARRPGAACPARSRAWLTNRRAAAAVRVRPDPARRAVIGGLRQPGRLDVAASGNS